MPRRQPAIRRFATLMLLCEEWARLLRIRDIVAAAYADFFTLIFHAAAYCHVDYTLLLRH